MMDKMNSIGYMLVVKCLELPHKFFEDFIAILKVLWSNNRSLEDLNYSNQFAVVFPMKSWEDISQ